MTENGPLEYIGTVYELNQICIEMGDADLTETLDTAIKLIAKPDVPPKAVAPLIVKLQALSMVFKLKAKHYMIFQKEGNATQKKNVYMSVAESLKELCDALKYLVRAA